MNLTERRRSRSLDVVAAALIVLLGAALPWGRSGRVDRSSFELVRLARRLDVLEGATATLAKLWLTAPMAVAAVTVAALSGRRRLAFTLGTVVVVAAVALAIVVHRSPVLPRYGLYVTMGGAGVLISAVALQVFARMRTHKSRSEPPS